MGRVEIVVGPMFSGKSTELIRRCSRYESVGLGALVINHSLDSRCSVNEVKTHGNAKHRAVKVSSLREIDLSVGADVIAVDEAQFFDDLVEFVHRCCSQCPDAIVIISGLDGDFMRRPFGQILECIPLADTVTKLNAMCSMCKDGTPAIFTRRIATGSDTVSIGGADKYMSVCRRHFV